MKFLKKLKKWNDTEDHSANANIFSAGDPADSLYVILSGELELTLDGDLLSTETAGGIVGEMAIIESAQQGATATSVTDVKLAKFNRDQLNEFMLQNAEFSLLVMDVLASRLRLVHEYNITNFNTQ